MKTFTRVTKTLAPDQALAFLRDYFGVNWYFWVFFPFISAVFVEFSSLFSVVEGILKQMLSIPSVFLVLLPQI